MTLALQIKAPDYSTFFYILCIWVLALNSRKVSVKVACSDALTFSVPLALLLWAKNAGNVNGAVEFGQKMFVLAVKLIWLVLCDTCDGFEQWLLQKATAVEN